MISGYIARCISIDLSPDFTAGSALATALASSAVFASMMAIPTIRPTLEGEHTEWGAGRESNPDLQLRTLPCCSVTLPTHWNSRRESNPDLFVRTEASSCLRPREPTKCG